MKSRLKYDQISQSIFFPYFMCNGCFYSLYYLSECPIHSPRYKKQKMKMIRHKPELKNLYFWIM